MDPREFLWASGEQKKSETEIKSRPFRGKSWFG